MKRLMTILMLFIGVLSFAQKTITVTANSEDISQSLDLHLVAKLFGEAQNTEEFETMLNNPDSAYSNLDLNGDGEIDYLRVVETGSTDSRLIIIQAVLAQDIYQDVASIYVERNQNNVVSVQVIGDEYVYGPNYIIEPVYTYRPIIYTWFWSSIWHPWCSPWYWDYYPHWWYHRHCYTYRWYWDRCYYFHRHHYRCSFQHPHTPRHGYHTMYGYVSHREYAERHPYRSFERRTTGVVNARDIRRPEPSVRSNVVKDLNPTVRSRTYDNRSSVSTRNTSTRSTNTQRTQTVRTTSTQRQSVHTTRTSSSTSTRSSASTVRSGNSRTTNGNVHRGSGSVPSRSGSSSSRSSGSIRRR